MQAESLLSISIVCYHTADAELHVLLTSIIASTDHLKSSIEFTSIVVYLIDNSERQALSLTPFIDLQEKLKDQNIEIRLIQGHGNIGYGRGHNLILNKLNSNYHLVLNSDIQLEKESLVSGISFLESNKEIVLASPYAQYANGKKQYLCKRYPSVLTFIVRGFFPSSVKKLFANRLAQFEMHDLSESEPSFGVTIASGCFMLCRTEAFNEIGGFDENYFLYFEDFDLSLRIGKLGKLAYVPAMRIQHTGGNVARKGWTHLKMFASSGIRFYNTYGWRFFRQTS